VAGQACKQRADLRDVGHQCRFGELQFGARWLGTGLHASVEQRTLDVVVQQLAR